MMVHIYQKEKWLKTWLSNFKFFLGEKSQGDSIRISHKHFT